jgi:saccharopine dehydrogenase (NAD+, L-lysine-forming)
VKRRDWKIDVVADITCDVPGSVPTTIRSTSIEKPFYGYNLAEDREDSPFGAGKVCVMAVDNLPSELPRDASEDFGRDLMDHVLPSLVRGDQRGVIERATICRHGELTSAFQYLEWRPRQADSVLMSAE